VGFEFGDLGNVFRGFKKSLKNIWRIMKEFVILQLEKRGGEGLGGD